MMILNALFNYAGCKPYRYNPEWVQNIWQTVRHLLKIIDVNLLSKII